MWWVLNKEIPELCNSICVCSNPKNVFLCVFLRCSGRFDSAHAERLHGKWATVQKGSHSVPKTVQRVKYQHRRPLEQPHTGVPFIWLTLPASLPQPFPKATTTISPATRWSCPHTTRTCPRWWVPGRRRRASRWSPSAARAPRWPSRRSTSDWPRTTSRGAPSEWARPASGGVKTTHRRSVTLKVCHSLWTVPVTYVNDSCSVAPECRQMFTLKTKSGKTHSVGRGWLFQVFRPLFNPIEPYCRRK